MRPHIHYLYGTKVNPDQIGQFITTVPHESMHYGVIWSDPSRRGHVDDDTTLSDPHMQVDLLAQEHMFKIIIEVNDLLFGEER